MTNFRSENGKIGWISPSNIAIVKYWGKHGQQYPNNTSLSFTLTNAHSKTIIEYILRKTPSVGIKLKFMFEGEENPKFAAKVIKYFETLQTIFPWLDKFDYVIHSSNTFPHSSGIASSASGMSAIALCIVELDQILSGEIIQDTEFYNRASMVARLGSGSACRSVFPYMSLWGDHEDFLDSSNECAIPFDEDLHPVFKTYRDDILIVSKKEKSVSSTAGHQLMVGNVYAPARYQQANKHISALKSICRDGNIDAFGRIAEDEALTLHALMMASNPSFILMEPNTIALIKKIRTYREDTQLPLYFTLDAGPNLHLLYPDSIYDQIAPFIEGELKPLCLNGLIIEDKVGTGPVKLGN